jgi:Tol biopolymer transport system component
MRAISTRVKVAAAVVLAVALGLVVPQSQATFPGSNGYLGWVQDGDVWKANPDGNVQSKLIDDADHPAWSVDGAWLLFDRQIGGKGDVFKASALGTLVTNLTNDAVADDIQPAWSPDNTQMVFASNRVGGEYRLFVMNTDGSGGLVQVTNGDNLDAGTDDGAPEWSPNGERIVFQRGNGSGGTKIFSMKANGTDVVQLSADTSPDTKPYDRLLTPKWSPNGSKIVFAAEAGCDSRIFVIGADGSNPAAVPDLGCVVAEPTWSPDGTIILVRVTARPVEGDGLFGFRVSDGATAKLVSGAGATSPDWEPLGGSPVTTTTSTSTTTTTPGSSTTSTTSTTVVVPPASKKSLPLIVRNGKWYLRNTATTGTADASFDYGNPTGDIAVTGDWDGNGTVTPGVVRGGTWYLRNANTSGVADASFAYGNPGDIPVTGDWDGNGSVTPGVVRNSTWYLRNSNSTGVADITFVYGNPGDLPVTGDWDSTGSTTPGVVRAGTWFLRNSNTPGNADASFGYGNPTGDIPLPGDWDGNGSVTPGIVRGGTWYVRNSNATGTADSSFGYGDAGDKPLTWRTA